LKTLSMKLSKSIHFLLTIYILGNTLMKTHLIYSSIIQKHCLTTLTH